jgi:hypothetical protein
VVLVAAADGRLLMQDKQKVDERAERLRQDKEALAWQLAHQDEVDQWWEEAVEPMSEAEKMLARAASLFGARPSTMTGANNTGGNRCASADSTRNTSGTAPGADEKSRSRGSTSPNGSARNARTGDRQPKLF